MSQEENSVPGGNIHKQVKSLNTTNAINIATTTLLWIIKDRRQKP